MLGRRSPDPLPTESESSFSKSVRAAEAYTERQAESNDGKMKRGASTSILIP